MDIDVNIQKNIIRSNTEQRQINVTTSQAPINVNQQQRELHVSSPAAFRIQVIEEGRMSEILDDIAELQNAVLVLNNTKMNTQSALETFVFNGSVTVEEFMKTYEGTPLEGRYLCDYLVEESGEWEDYFVTIHEEIEKSEDLCFSVPFSEDEMVTFTISDFGGECLFARWKTARIGRVMFDGADAFVFFDLTKVPGEIEGLNYSYSNLNSTKQNKNDNSLQTTSKNVVGAINEVLNTSLTSEYVEEVGFDATFDGTRLAQAELDIDALETRAATDEASITQLGNEKQNKNGNTELETSDKSITGAINEVRTIAIGREKAVVYNTYPAMVNALNQSSSDFLKVGDNVYVVTPDVPDLWVQSIESSQVQYQYTTDEAFVNELKEQGWVQVGYFKFAKLEIGKVDLENVVDSNSVISASGTGNTVTGMSVDENGNVTLEKGITALTEHQDISGKQNVTDDSLTTESKNVAGAINELDARMLYFSVVSNI